MGEGGWRAPCPTGPQLLRSWAPRPLRPGRLLPAGPWPPPHPHCSSRHRLGRGHGVLTTPHAEGGALQTTAAAGEGLGWGAKQAHGGSGQTSEEGLLGHWCLCPWAGGGGGGAGRHAPPPLHPMAASTPPRGPQLRSCCPWSPHTGDRAGPSGWGNLGLTLGDPQSQPLPLRAHWKGSLHTHAPSPGLLMAGRGHPHTAPPLGTQGLTPVRQHPGAGVHGGEALQPGAEGRQRLPLDTCPQAQGVAWHIQVTTDHRHGSRGLGAQQSWDWVLSWAGPTQRVGGSKEPL